MSLPHVCICEKCRREMGGIVPLTGEAWLANYAQAITEARAILEPLAEYDPAIRAWLKRNPTREQKP